MLAEGAERLDDQGGAGGGFWAVKRGLGAGGWQPLIQRQVGVNKSPTALRRVFFFFPRKVKKESAGFTESSAAVAKI